MIDNNNTSVLVYNVHYHPTPCLPKRYQKAHHTKMANYMEGKSPCPSQPRARTHAQCTTCTQPGPETQKKLDFIHNAHDLVKNEKDPTVRVLCASIQPFCPSPAVKFVTMQKRRIIHDKVRDTIMEIEVCRCACWTRP